MSNSQLEQQTASVMRLLPSLNPDDVRAVLTTEQTHKTLKADLNQLLEKYPEVKREIIYEAATGIKKFGKDSVASATHFITITDDLTQISAYDIRRDADGRFLDPDGERFFEQLVKDASFVIRFKSYQFAWRSVLSIYIRATS